MRRIYRYEVPVDGRWHGIRCRAVLHVACRQVDTVEFWAYPPGDDTPATHFTVCGTGQETEDDVQYIGTALAPEGGLVWHLMAKW